MRQAVRAAAPSLSLPHASPLLRRAQQWLAAAPDGAPALLPPFVVEIR